MKGKIKNMNEILNPNTNVTFGRNLDNEVFLEVRRNVNKKGE